MMRFILSIALLGFALPCVAQDEVAMQSVYEAVAASAAEYTIVESVVEIDSMGDKVVGTLAMPQGEGPFPIALLLHGFTGTRDELPVLETEEGMFSRAARWLAERGLASLRIDFRGSGESGGAWEDTTFTGQIADALAAMDYAAGLVGVDAEHIAIIGLSQGGLVGAAVAAQDARVANLVLWSPVANPAITFRDILGSEWISAGMNSGGEVVVGTLPWGAEIGLRTGFFEELFLVDPVAEISRYDGPLQVIVGARDDIVAPQPHFGQIYLNYHDGAEQLVVLDGDHVFDVLEIGPAVLDEAIAWTLTWLWEMR